MSKRKPFPQPGAGSILAGMLEAVYLKNTPDCECEELAALMDKKGPAWCRKHLDYLVDRIAENATRLQQPQPRLMIKAAVVIAIARATLSR